MTQDIWTNTTQNTTNYFLSEFWAAPPTERGWHTQIAIVSPYKMFQGGLQLFPGSEQSPAIKSFAKSSKMFFSFSNYCFLNSLYNMLDKQTKQL